MMLEAGEEKDSKTGWKVEVTIVIHIRLQLIWAAHAISKPISDITPGFLAISEGMFGNVIVPSVSPVLCSPLGRVRESSFVWLSSQPLLESVRMS
jgi:hypothetical protein